MAGRFRVRMLCTNSEIHHLSTIPKIDTLLNIQSTTAPDTMQPQASFCQWGTSCSPMTQAQSSSRPRNRKKSSRRRPGRSCTCPTDNLSTQSRRTLSHFPSRMYRPDTRSTPRQSSLRCTSRSDKECTPWLRLWTRRSQPSTWCRNSIEPKRTYLDCKWRAQPAPWSGKRIPRGNGCRKERLATRRNSLQGKTRMPLQPQKSRRQCHRWPCPNCSLTRWSHGSELA